jgi:hypothetical protein
MMFDGEDTNDEKNCDEARFVNDTAFAARRSAYNRIPI